MLWFLQHVSNVPGIPQAHMSLGQSRPFRCTHRTSSERYTRSYGFAGPPTGAGAVRCATHHLSYTCAHHTHLVPRHCATLFASRTRSGRPITTVPFIAAMAVTASCIGAQNTPSGHRRCTCPRNPRLPNSQRVWHTRQSSTRGAGLLVGQSYATGSPRAQFCQSG